VIEGFCFQGFIAGVSGGTGILVTWDGTTAWADNVTIRNCYFNDDVNIGIQLDYAWYCEISDCKFDQCVAYGIYCDPADSAADFGIAKNNQFYDVGLAGGGAMSLDEVDGWLIQNNSIYNALARTPAAATDQGINLGAGAGNMVVANFFSYLLPVPAAGDIDDFCSGSNSDCWAGNYCLNGLLVTQPSP
jgi:hypothetical protein